MVNRSRESMPDVADPDSLPISAVAKGYGPALEELCNCMVPLCCFTWVDACRMRIVGNRPADHTELVKHTLECAYISLMGCGRVYGMRN